jgi:hypothetical protein
MKTPGRINEGDSFSIKSSKLKAAMEKIKLKLLKVETIKLIHQELFPFNQYPLSFLWLRYRSTSSSFESAGAAAGFLTTNIS